MTVVNSGVIDFTLLISREDKEIKGSFIKSGCGYHLFPRSAMLERLSQNLYEEYEEKVYFKSPSSMM